MRGGFPTFITTENLPKEGRRDVRANNCTFTEIKIVERYISEKKKMSKLKMS